MRVTVGVSGGIAAYKAAELVRALQRQAVEVHVVMTAAAQRFVQPLTFAALTGHKVITSLWEDWSADDAAEQNGIDHIAEAQWADALVVAPATANILAKFAHGIADDFLSTMYLATTAPVLVAPAMNVNMWNHPATQANLEILRQRGVRLVEPGTGDLACGMVGAGRMAEPEAIADAVLKTLGRRHDLAGEVVLVTAGGTREALDPVRFIGNRSSGKMGYALAEAAQSRGAKVILISGPSALHAPAHCELVKVTTADEMRNAVLDAHERGHACHQGRGRGRLPARRRLRAEAQAHRTASRSSLRPLKTFWPKWCAAAGRASSSSALPPRPRTAWRTAAPSCSPRAQTPSWSTMWPARAWASTPTPMRPRSSRRTTAIELPEMPKRQLADRILDEILTLRRPRSVVVETR